MVGRGGFVPSAPGCYATEDGQRGSSGSHDMSSTLFALQLSQLSIYEAWRRREHVPDIVTMPTKSRHINCMWGQELAKPFFFFWVDLSASLMPRNPTPSSPDDMEELSRQRESIALFTPSCFVPICSDYSASLDGFIFRLSKKKITTSQEKHQPKTK